MERIRIERGSVQETLVIPLYARHVLEKTYPDLADGQDTSEVLARIDYDFSDQERLMHSAFGRFGALEVAQREYDLAWEASDYLKHHPDACVCNLGAGLLDVFGRVDNGRCQGANIDFPEVIAARQEILGTRVRERDLAFDLTDHAWMDEVDCTHGCVFVAAGVFYYLTTDDVRDLVRAMARRFPGSVLAFDAVNRLGLRMMARTVLEQTGMEDVSALFSLEDPAREIAPWSDGIASVTTRSYMNGYRELPQDAGTLNRLLSWLSDVAVKMRIVRIEFR